MIYSCTFYLLLAKMPLKVANTRAKRTKVDAGLSPCKPLHWSKKIHSLIITSAAEPARSRRRIMVLPDVSSDEGSELEDDTQRVIPTRKRTKNTR